VILFANLLVRNVVRIKPVVSQEKHVAMMVHAPATELVSDVVIVIISARWVTHVVLMVRVLHRAKNVVEVVSA
jgi:hypothetical protein